MRNGRSKSQNSIEPMMGVLELSEQIVAVLEIG